VSKSLRLKATVYEQSAIASFRPEKSFALSKISALECAVS